MGPALAPEAARRPRFSDAGKLAHGGEKIAYRHLARRHTRDGRYHAALRKRDVDHAENLFFNGMYPFHRLFGGRVDRGVWWATRISHA